MGFCSISRKCVNDMITIMLICTITFGYYFDSSIPNDLKEISLFNFTIRSYYFEDIGTLVYILKMKVYLIIMSVVWYFTSKEWWKSSILVIITIEVLKLISAFSPNQRYMDEIEFISSLPITIPIIVLLIYISKKIKSFNHTRLIRNEVDKEIDKLFFEIYTQECYDINNIKRKYKKLKTQQHLMGEHEYLKKLINLRDSFYKL